MGSPLAADLALIYCSIVWGASFYLTKGALNSVSPLALIACRFLIATLLLAPWAARRSNIWRRAREGAVLAFFLSIIFITQTFGLKYTSASNSAFITALFVVIVPLFLWLYRRARPRLAQLFSIAIALTGLWLLTGGVSRFNRGDALTLLTAVACAAHLLATDHYAKRDDDTTLLAFHQLWITGLIASVAALAARAPMSVESMSVWGAIAYLGVFATFSTYIIQTWAQRHAPPVEAAMIFILEPVFGSIFAWTLGGEAFEKTKALGGVIIVAALIASELSRLPLVKARRREVLPL